MTNAQKIREMSDRELAELLTEAHFEGADAALFGINGIHFNERKKRRIMEAGTAIFTAWLNELAEGG